MMSKAATARAFHALNLRGLARAIWRKRVPWLPLLVLWTALPLVVTTSADLVLGQPPSLPKASDLPYLVIIWWPWAILTPVINRLGQRFPIRSAHGIPHAVVHLLASWLVVVVLNLHAALMAFLLNLPWSPRDILHQMFHVFDGIGPLAQLLYWLVLAACATLTAHQRARERQARLTEARLDSLTAQLQPHFLFNTLNTISALIDEDTAAARQMVSHLGDLLRANLRRHGAQEVTLDDELDLVHRYLDIEAVRFGERLRYQEEVAIEVRQARVPRLLLQPLVENAVRHGMGRDAAAGQISLEAGRLGATLRIRIHDDGPGLRAQAGDAGPTTPRQGDGISLTNLRARLETLYGRAGQLSLRPRAPRGTTVQVELPYRPRQVEDLKRDSP